MKKRIVIVGSSFAGYNTAVTLAKLLSGKHEVMVIDKKPEFTFSPSFVRVPFGYQNKNDITFDTRSIYKGLGITFTEAFVYGFDLEDQLIYTHDRDIEYDYLVIATGARPRYESVKGLYPGENSYSICDFDQAKKTKKAWAKFLKNPGPIVIGAAQWAGYFFAAYEFLFTTVHHLQTKKLLAKASINFITPEPYLGHFGIGGFGHNSDKWGDFFKHFQINSHISSEIHEIKSKEVVLENGTHLESDFTMIIPQFIGVDAVRTTPNFADVNGLLVVTDEFRHSRYPNVYAAGGSVSIPQLNEAPIGLGVPRTLTSSEIMAKAAAQNLASNIIDGPRISISTQEIYEYCRKDIDYLNKMISVENENSNAAFGLIAKASQDTWTNMTMKEYIESSLSKDSLEI